MRPRARRPALPEHKDRLGCFLATLLITAAIARIGAIAGFHTLGPAAAPAPDNPERVYRSTVLSMQAEDAVKAKLRDSASATFRHEVVVRSRNGVAVCGEVNARNDTGAYMGFTQFIVIKAVMLRTRKNDAEFAKIWNRACR